MVRAAVVRDGRHGGARGRAQPRAAPTGPGSTGPPLPRARELLGLVRTVRLLPRGPHPGQGRPVRPAPVPRRPAGAAHAAAGRRPRRLRPGAAAAQLAAQDRRPRAAASRRGSRRWRPSASGTTTSPGPAPSCSPRGSPLVDAAAAVRRQGLRDRRPRRVPRGRRDRVPRRRSTSPGATDRDRTLDRRAARRGRAAPRRRARPRHLPGRPAPRRAAAHARLRRQPGCRCKGYASHGESWSFALALRLASYDLLRADGDDPILILDDVFAELDTERRTSSPSWSPAPSRCWSPRRSPTTCPPRWPGSGYDVGDGEVTRDG